MTTTPCRFHQPFQLAHALGLLLIFALLVISTLGSLGVDACPSSCTCNLVSRRGDREGRGREGRRPSRREVVCSGRGLKAPIDPTTVPKDTVQLDLSNNQITSLRQNTFAGLSSLLQLNLSGNCISYIEPKSFDGLDQLQKLDLSRNRLGGVNNSMFVGLGNLVDLSISYNQISTIAAASFDRLQEIVYLDFASDYLVCDCQLKWIVRWMKDNKVRIADTTVCAFPQSMRGEKVRQLKRKELHCDWPLELPMFELEPDNSQVVFKGDTIPIECRATYLEGAEERIQWFKSGRLLKTNLTAGVNITTTVLRDQARIRSTLLLYKIQMDGTSIWDIECRVTTSRGIKRKRVTVIILDNNDTKYCPPKETLDNRGTFNWPETIAGITESIVCPHGVGTSHMGSFSQAVATRKCNLRGVWEDPDTSQCEYANELTWRLESASLMTYNNLTMAVPIAKEIESSTADPAVIQDKMDITFIARTLDKFSRLRNVELGEVMINIASNVMEVRPEILKQSQAYNQACSKIVQSLEKFAQEVPRSSGQVFNHKAANIAMEVFNLDTDTFTGMACASFRTSPLPANAPLDQETGLQDFRCFMGDTDATSTQMTRSKGVVEASIQLPSSVVAKVTEDNFQLQFFIYKNSQLFPSVTNSSNTAEDRGRRRVAGQVISSKIAGSSVRNITSPVILNFRTPAGGRDQVPGYWDYTTYPEGAWMSRGCTIIRQTGNLTTVHCNHLTNFALLMDTTSSGGVSKVRSIDLLHPAIYVGSLIFVVFVFWTMVSYICFNSNIRLKRKCRHSLMNMCFGFLNLVMFFAGGVNRTEPLLLCRVVGLGIHYFSLCCLLWIGIGARNLLKGLTRKERVLPPGEAPPPPRPILRFYFMGWGIPMIVVGITAAANIGNYGGEQICWMDFSISLAACFGVAGFFVLITFIMFVAVAVRLGWKPPEESKASQPSTDLDPHTNIDSESVVTHRTALSTVSSILDGEYTYARQLKASVILLLGFLITWTLAAMAVTQTPFLAMLFSYLYGAAIALLGLFIFMYNCILRGDVMYNWRRTCGCTKSRNAYAVALSGSHPGSQVGSQVIPPGNGHVVQRCQSASSVDSNVTNRSANTNQSNHSLKSGSRKASKCNYVPSHTNTGTDASIDSSTQDTVARPHMYEKARGNGYAHRYHHKGRNRPKGYKHSRYSQITRDTSDAGATPEVCSVVQPTCYADSVSSGSVMARVPPVVMGNVTGEHEGSCGLHPSALSGTSMQGAPAGPVTTQPMRPQWPMGRAVELPNLPPQSMPVLAAHSSNNSIGKNVPSAADTQPHPAVPHITPLDRQEGAALRRRASREDSRRSSGKNKIAKGADDKSLPREEVPLLENHPSTSEPPTYDEATRATPMDDQVAKQPLEAKDVEESAMDGAAVEMDSLSQADHSDQDGSDKRETSV